MNCTDGAGPDGSYTEAHALSHEYTMHQVMTRV